MNRQINETNITKILNDSKKVRDIIQSGINQALLQHKHAGNPICESRDGKVVWIQPEDITIKNT